MRMSPRLLLAALSAVLLVSAGCGGGGGSNCEDGKCPPTVECGNGSLQSGEQCDDGNKTNGDGCEATCTPTPTPTQVCGNGWREGTEQCDDGNTASGDGCEAACTVTLTRCAAADAPALPGGATCAVTRAGNAARLFTGVVLKDGETLLGGQVLVDAQGVIQCAACDCSAAAGAADATQVSCPGGVISPGLINPHEHINYPTAPYVGTEERYEHRHEWRTAKNGHTRITSAMNNNADLVRWAELRQLMAGATSIAGAGGQPGLLRNLDVGSGIQQEGLGEGVVNSDTFPLDDSNGTLNATGCAYGTGMKTTSTLPAVAAYLPHVAEGIADTARNEFQCLSFGSNDIIKPRTAIIHGVGLTAAEIALMAERGTGLIWSPRSNVALYGDTAMVTAYKRLGVSIALGTDWLRSGSMNLLRELQCADYLNASHYGRAFSDEQLWRMVTVNAADLTDVFEKTGRIAPGKVGDLAIYQLRTFASSPHRAVITANPEHVVLTVRGGKALYGDQALVDALKGSDTCDTLDVCGTAKAACVQSEIGKNLAALTTAAGTDPYPLFACGTPKDEPVCAPRRNSADSRWPAAVNGSNPYTGEVVASDKDGDGLSDASDNCPSVFNPIRPLDNRKQADADNDGVGDACDPCPLAAGSACTLFTVGDDDHDTRPTWQDNCPFTANPDQVDRDSDGKGDACDACPSVSNPGELGCPSTIHELKTPVGGSLPLVGKPVALTDVLVTAVARGTATTNGYWVQAHPVPSGKSEDYSGLYVYSPKGDLVAGDRIDISTGTLILFNGLPELTDVKYVKRSSGNALPAPVVVTSADVRTGGPRASALEGVLVEVRGVTSVTTLDQFGQFLVSEDAAATTGLMVDDQAYQYTAPAKGTQYSAVRGVLTFNFNDSKVVPRAKEDLVLVPPAITAFGPSGGFARVGGTGPVNTFPQALTLTLSNGYPDPLDITVTSSAPSALRVPNGRITVPAMQTSVTVQVEALAQAQRVTLTATVGGSQRSADVRVLGANEQPQVVRITPDAVTLIPGGSASLTVELDRPAPAGATVALSMDPATGFGVFNVRDGALAVAENATQAQFIFTADETATIASGTVKASIGGSEAQVAVTLDQDAPRLTALEPASAVTVPAGGTQPFRLVLANAPTEDIVVTLAATPTGTTPYGTVPASVTVPAGMMEATFTFTADAQGEGSGTVSATLFGLSRSTTVNVTPPPPKLATLSPASATVVTGGTFTFTVTLDRAAQTETTDVELALAPASVGSVPATTVRVPLGARQQTFVFTAAALTSPAQGTVTARFGGVEQTATVNVVLPNGQGLVINEVDYDMVGANDGLEFVELYNPTSASIPLTGLSLVFINGNGGKSYRKVDLSAAADGVLNSKEYLVVGPPLVINSLSNQPGVKTLPLNPNATTLTNLIENGAPDAVVIYSSRDDSLIDALSYEGAVTNATIEGTTTVFARIQEGDASTAGLADSNTVQATVCRNPEGRDTNINATDFRVVPKPTPGAVNEWPATP